jgi:serine/threonine-protein kinase
VPVPPGAASTAVDARALAKLNLAISPWGEVFVDGKRRGVTPPLTEIRLPPGRYDVEIRNSSFPVHRETVELFADAPLRIRHKFQ